jgi:hypothetical protein
LPAVFNSYAGSGVYLIPVNRLIAAKSLLDDFLSRLNHTQNNDPRWKQLWPPMAPLDTAEPHRPTGPAKSRLAVRTFELPDLARFAKIYSFSAES